MKSTSIGRQAVVIGAGMGGLSAARALADYFENVVVLERYPSARCIPPNRDTPGASHPWSSQRRTARAQRPLSRLCPGPSRSRGGTSKVGA